jgi:hypothetical protein
LLSFILSIYEARNKAAISFLSKKKAGTTLKVVPAFFLLIFD